MIYQLRNELKTATAVVIGALGIVGGTAAISSAEQAGPQPLSCTSPDAVSLAPLAANSITLGAYTGVAYYTVEDTGYQVVATVAPGEAGLPIRFVSTLADGQNVMLSVPQSLGSPALDVEFHRCGDAVLVRGPASLPPAIAVAQ
jgi:hypothetical protein